MVCRIRASRLVTLLVAAVFAISDLTQGALADDRPIAASPHQRNKPMRIHIVQDTRAGCAPACGRWIAMEGQIERGTAAVFERVVRALGSQNLPIFIDSGGGSVSDAMAIGRSVRARHLDVVVTETVFDDCPAEKACRIDKHGDVRGGYPNAIGSLCASACVLVLAAGERRGAAPWTRVGVHRMVTKQTVFRKERLFRIWTRMVGGTKVEIDRELVRERRVELGHRTVAASQSLYDQVGAYLGRMGIKPTLLSLMEATPSDAIHLLTRDEAAATAIVTDASDGTFLLEEAARKTPEDHATIGAAPGCAYILRPGSGVPAVEPGRVIWSLVRNPPGSTAAQVALRAEVTTATLTFSLQLAPGSGRDKDVIGADMSFKPPNSTAESVERVLPLQKRAFTTLARANLTGTFQPLVATLHRGALIPGVDLAGPLPSGERGWLSARGVTNRKRLVEVMIEIPPPSLLEAARTAWGQKTSSADGSTAPENIRAASP